MATRGRDTFQLILSPIKAKNQHQGQEKDLLDYPFLSFGRGPLRCKGHFISPELSHFLTNNYRYFDRSHWQNLNQMARSFPWLKSREFKVLFCFFSKKRPHLFSSGGHIQVILIISIFISYQGGIVMVLPGFFFYYCQGKTAHVSDEDHMPME